MAIEDTIVSAIAALIAAGGLFYTGFQFKKGSDTQYFATINEIAKELVTLENSQERNDDYASFGAKYLNFLDRIAFLALKGIIPKDVAMYFTPNLAAALALLDEPSWTKLIPKRRLDLYKQQLKYLKTWCANNDIKPLDPPLSAP